MDVGEEEEDGGEEESEGEEGMPTRGEAEEEIVYEGEGDRDGHHLRGMDGKEGGAELQVSCRGGRGGREEGDGRDVGS